MIKNKNIKKAYIIPCPSQFRDKIDVLCRKKKVNPGDIARSIILTVNKDVISKTEDIGEPSEEDREFFFAKTDKKKQKPIKRKPRIQLRMPDGHDTIFIRKALTLATLFDEGKTDLKSECEHTKKKAIKHDKLLDENERLKAIIYALMFEPLKKEISSKEEAFYILGFQPFEKPTLTHTKQRFRMLATIHHPDSELGSDERMKQVNEAFNFLKRNFFF